MIRINFAIFGMLFLSISMPTWAAEVSFTFDDFDVNDKVMFNAQVRNVKILKVLDSHRIKATLFVKAKNVETPSGKALLKEWDHKGHQIANHTYAHLSYSSPEVSFPQFTQDILKAESLIRDTDHFKNAHAMMLAPPRT